MDYNAFQTPNKSAFPPEINDVLEREFDAKTEIEKRSGGGSQVFYYPRGEAIVQRLNEAFGSCWSFRVQEYFKDTLAEDTVIVLGELIINHPDYPMRVIQQFAGKQIGRNRNGGIINMANDYKSAASLALRKCAMQIGVGLYLTKGLPDEDLLETNDNKSTSKEAVSSPSAPVPSSPKTIESNNVSTGPLATERQTNFAKSLYKKKGITEEVDFEKLTSRQASAYINAWKELPDITAKTETAPKPSTVDKKNVKKDFSETAQGTPGGEESADLQKFRTIAAETIGQDDPNVPDVDRFMLHVYKSNFGKELGSVGEISPRELKTLIESIDVDE